jgi:RHS repeat-associated protein
LAPRASAGGSLAARTDGKGQTAYFEYDDLGRQVAALYALVEPVYFAYDVSGNRTVMQDEWGAAYWTYDVLGRPTSRQDPRGTTVYYAYGDRGERTELTVQGQGTVYYEYGPTGVMSYVLDGKTGLFTYYEYDPASRARYQHHPNATATYFVYDLAGRLTEKVTKKDADASVLVRFAYTRDAAGNPIAIERESGLGVFYYAYDALQRLAYEGQFVSDVRQYENYYEYDPAGNRTLLRHGETDAENLTYYEYDEANELVNLHDKDGWTYFAYDGNGDTVTEQTPSWTRYYDWDGRDMMVGVRSTEDGWTDSELRYDGLASRAELVDSTGTTRYTWDGIKVLKTQDGAGSLKQRQVHGHAVIESVGDIAQMESGGSQYVPVADQVGTVWKVLSSGTATANSYLYDAFGVSRAVSESFTNPFRFAGKPLDSDPALCHFLARQYLPRGAGFVSRDPGQYMPGYAYTQQRPLSNADPWGLSPGKVPDPELAKRIIKWLETAEKLYKAGKLSKEGYEGYKDLKDLYAAYFQGDEEAAERLKNKATDKILDETASLLSQIGGDRWISSQPVYWFSMSIWEGIGRKSYALVCREDCALGLMALARTKDGRFVWIGCEHGMKEPGAATGSGGVYRAPGLG